MLDEALRQALTSASAGQVAKRIVNALPAGALVSANAGPHGDEPRKVTISMPGGLTEAVRAHSGGCGFSRYVTEAVQERINHDLIEDLAADFEAKFGPIDEELLEEAKREWPDYEDS